MVFKTIRCFRLFLIPLFALSLLSGCLADKDKQSDLAENSAPIPFVLSAEVTPAQHSQWSLAGFVTPQSQAALSFQVKGQIVQRYVNPGDPVKANQKLLLLDTQDTRLRLNVLEANLEGTQAELKLAQIEAQRVDELLARDLMSQQERDRAQNRIKTLQQQVRALEREIDMQRRQVDYTLLYAPAEGVIQEVLVDQGEIVQAGQTVLQIIYNQGLDFVVNFPQSRLNQVPQQAQLHINEQQFEVTLREFAPKAHPGSRTWSARYALNEDELPAHVLIGQTGRLIVSQEHDALLSVPLSALVENGQGTQLWRLVAEDQHPTQRRVEAVAIQVHHISQDQAKISGDIAAGDRIVAAGVHRIQDAQQVQERQ